MINKCIYIYKCGKGFLWFNWFVGQNCCMCFVCLAHRINDGTGTFTYIQFCFSMGNKGKYSIH